MATDIIARGIAETKLSKGGGTIAGSLEITGDLHVNGTTVTTRQETLMIKDNIIVTNADGKVLQGTSGLAIRSGSSLVYGLVYDPTSDTVMFGIGSLDSSNNFTFNENEGLPLAVRADSSLFVDGHFVKWDATNYCFVDGGSVSDIPNQKPFNPSWTTSSFTALIADVYADTKVVAGDVYIGTVSGGKTGGMPFDGNAEVRIEVNTANRGVLHCEITSSNVSPYHWECQVVAGHIYPWRSWVPTAPDGVNDLITNSNKIANSYIDMDNSPIENGVKPVKSGGVYTELEKKLDKNGDGSSTTVSFTAAAERQNVATGESQATLWGKTAKWLSDLGTSAFKNVPTSGDASATEVVLGDDTRLTNARNAADVYAWAKESTKPTYTYSEIQDTPTIPVVNNGTLTIQKNGDAVSTFTANSSENITANITVPTAISELSTDNDHLTVTSTEKTTWSGKLSTDGNGSDLTTTFTEASQRANITSGETIAVSFGKIEKNISDLKSVAFSGSYNDLENTPTIPVVNNATLTIQKNGTSVGTFTANDDTDETVNITVPTALSELTTDTDHLTVTTAEKSNWSGKLATNGDGSNVTVSYSEAQERANVVSGESLSTSFGKIQKNISDLKNVAFSGSYNDLSNTPTIPTVNNASLTIQKNGTTVQTFTANASSDVTANIEVPTQTSQLTNNGADGTSPYATEGFVNSSVSTNTASFCGTYNIVTDLGLTTSATEQQIIVALAAKMTEVGITPTNNDYCFVSYPDATDPTQFTKYDRYKYENSNSGWSYEYTLNNSSFTAAQWAAINSGITSSSVTQITTNTNDIGNIRDGVTINSFAGVESALSGKQPTITGAATTVVSENLSTGKALVSDGNGKIAASSVTSTELGYVSGVTSAIQTQLSGKLGTSGDGSSTTVSFTAAAERQNVATGESQATLWGKTAKWLSDLGTSAFKNVPTSGDASSTEVVLGDDSRLTNSRNAADVYSWAKASTKPTYTYSEIQNTPTIPVVNNGTLTIQKNGETVNTFTANSSSDITANITVPTAISELSTDNDHLTVTSTEKTTWSGKLSTNGDGSDLTTTFTEAAQRANISSGETIAVSFGKIEKNISDLKSVAFSGSYSDLSNTPTIPVVNNATLTIRQNETEVGSFTANSGTDATVDITVPTALSDLSEDEDHLTVTSGEKSTWDAKLSTTGNGSNLTATYSEAADRTNLVSGEKLSVSLGKIKKYFTDLKSVAFSGSYADLSNKPAIPTVNNATLTIKRNGTSVQTFTANASTDVTADITVPTKTSDLNNDSGFITSSALPTVNNATLTIQKNGTTVQTFTANASTDVTADISVPTQTSQLTNNGSDGASPYATESFVNSSISTNTANFIGTFASVSALNSYSGTVTNNDYAFVTNGVITDNGNDFATFAALNAYSKSLVTNFDYAWVINGAKFDLYRFDIVNQQWDLRVQNTDKASVTLNSAYNRYKASVSSNVVTWSYEYTLNNSSFTAAQWTAINSGITSADVSQISTNTTNIGNITNGTSINSFSGVEGALANKQATITGGASTIATNNLTANRALVSDASGKVGVSSTTATELGYLSGVTSAIQTQLSNKLATTGGTISGNLSVMGSLSDNKGTVASNQIFGIREGSYINSGDTLYINTDIPIPMIVSMLSNLDLTESVDVEGTPVDVSAILFEDENNNTEGVYMADLSVLGGTGYIIFLAKVVGTGSYQYEQVLFVSDVSDPTNEVLIQEFFPTFTMPSDAGWLVESVMITTNVGPIIVLRDQQSSTVAECAKYISGMFTLDTSLRDMIKFMIDYSVTSVLNTPV